MHIKKLDHINLRTAQLSTMIDWYENVLGLTNGARPDFPFPGAWLYAGDTIVVHLIGVEGDAGVGSEADLKMEHFAFTAEGEAEFEDRLKSHGQTYKRSVIEAINLAAYNVWDPDGNHIHVDFQMAG